jgi:hypothetical protein
MGFIMDWLITDWLILVLVTPLIVTIVVLLYGFVGCGLDVVGTGPSKSETAPSNLKATAIGTDRIELEWQDNAGGVATWFKIERLQAGGWFTVPPTPTSPHFQEGGWEDGTDHTYRVSAILSGVSYDSNPTDPATATTHPNAPTNLRLTPQEGDQIDLEWDHVTKSDKQVNFRVEHRAAAAAPAAGGSFTQIFFGPLKKFTHKDPVVLTPGSGHEYKVTAVVNGFDNSAPTLVSSLPSATGSAKTWAVAFSAGLTTDQPPNGVTLQGYCLVQRIGKALLQNSGTRVRIRVQGSSAGKLGTGAGQLTLNRVYISQPAVSGDRWDSLPLPAPGGITKVVDTDKMDPAVKLGVVPSLDPDPSAMTLVPIDYNLDKTHDLLIAFDISNLAGQGNVRFVLLPGTGTESYLRGPQGNVATEQAAKADRLSAQPAGVPAYATAVNRLYLVEKIEVL